MTHHEPPMYELLDLDQVEADYRGHLEESSTLGAYGQAAINAVPGLVAALREARHRIEYLEGLPTEQEFIVCVGGDRHPDDCEATLPAADIDEAIIITKAIGEDKAKIHMRSKSIHSWIHLDSEPPF